MSASAGPPLWKRIICIVRPLVSRQQAVEIARAECNRRDRQWREPVRVMSGLSTTYCVMTNAEAAGCNHLIYIDKCDGTVRAFKTALR